MKIGIDASRANVAQRTGTEQYAYYLIQEFKKLADPLDQFFLYTEEPLGYGLEALPPNFQAKVLRWPPQFLWTQLRFSAAMMRRQPDALFVPAHTLPIIHPQRSVVTLHDVGFERFDRLYMTEQIGHSGIGKRVMNLGARIFTGGRYGASELDYHRWATAYTIRHATKIITVSEFSKQEIVACYPEIDPQRIAVIHHGLDHTKYQFVEATPARTEILRRYGISQPFLLYIGRLEEKKNTAGLIDIFAHVKQHYAPPLQLVLVGKPGYGFEKITQRVAARHLERDVILPGFVGEEDLVALRSAAQAFVFPSYYEGFGLPLLEAMACQTPIVTSNRASLPEIAGSAALIADPDHHSEFAERILEVLTQPHLRAELIAKGKHRAAQFSWTTAAKKTLEVIKTAAT